MLKQAWTKEEKKMANIRELKFTWQENMLIIYDITVFCWAYLSFFFLALSFPKWHSKDMLPMKINGIPVKEMDGDLPSFFFSKKTLFFADGCHSVGKWNKYLKDLKSTRSWRGSVAELRRSAEKIDFFLTLHLMITIIIMNKHWNKSFTSVKVQRYQHN